MTIAEKLSKYREMRNFRVTPEPTGRERRRGVERGPVFVVQKHRASHLHYDFRLEIGGVLKSWAVPKGPSLDPKTRHLAMPTEDHPIQYAAFEGVIPAGEYGGGAMIVWDRGRYENALEASMDDGYDNGHLRVRLLGKKLKGEFSLRRMPGRNGGRASWLLVKIKDAAASAGRRGILADAPQSILSGLTVEEIAARG